MSLFVATSNIPERLSMKTYTDENAILYLLTLAKEKQYNFIALQEYLSDKALPAQFVSFAAAFAYKKLLRFILNATDRTSFTDLTSFLQFSLGEDIYYKLLYAAHTRNLSLADLFDISCGDSDYHKSQVLTPLQRHYEGTTTLSHDMLLFLTGERNRHEAHMASRQETILNVLDADPSEYWRDFVCGYLTVRTGPSKGDNNPQAQYQCLCRACGRVVSITRAELELGACPVCYDALEMAGFDLQAKHAFVAEVVTSRQEKIRSNGLKFAKENLLKLYQTSLIGFNMRADGTIKYSANSEVLKAAQSDYIAFRWRIGIDSCDKDLTVPQATIRWAGFPISKLDQLHRLGHEDDDVTDQTPYSPETIVWLSSSANKSIKSTNTQIVCNGTVHPSLESACSAVGLKAGTLRQRIRRNPSKTPQQHFDAMLAQEIASDAM